uniref:Cyclin-dependent kinase inhibitor domain-containing protein n=1 Tax=Eptatretus burgeri TaxID=7764 RepID=A0A8C4R4P2_EPTBU
MSDVRVPGGGNAGSGGAAGGSTLQSGARRSPLFPRAAVCRSLFGPVDHAETHKRLREEVSAMGEERKRRWDFDFDSEEPLRGGKFVWEAVEARAVPRFYRARGFAHEGGSQARRAQRDVCRNGEENKGEEKGNPSPMLQEPSSGHAGRARPAHSQGRLLGPPPRQRFPSLIVLLFSRTLSFA